MVVIGTFNQTKTECELTLFLLKVHELQTYPALWEETPANIQVSWRKPHDKPENYIRLLPELRGWASGSLSANTETADGLCVESFTSPGAGPGQNSSVIILRVWIKPPLSACRRITLWLRYCFGIYSPVGYCKARFLCRHQLQPAGITEPLWMGSHLLWMLCSKAGQSILFSTIRARRVWFHEDT